MRNPNGYGSVYKLPGRRRKPWVARKTINWDFDVNTGKCSPVYEFIGYYKTQKEANIALANYNENPFDLVNNTLTFSEVYDRWSNEHFDKVSESAITGYKASYKLCESLYDVRFTEIRFGYIQKIIDQCGKNTPTLKKLKILIGLMYDYAVINDIVPPAAREKMRYLDISKPGNPNAYDRTRFSNSEIKKVWKVKDNNIYYTVILMLIYTGVRIGELLELKKTDVHLEEKWFYISNSKTNAGIRTVPIAEKILPFFEYWANRDCEYLICNDDNKKMSYDKFYHTHWKKLMKNLNIKHTPHCTRYTCISLLTEAGVDKILIKKIVGHKGMDITESIYTQISMDTKLEAINKI
ncbi:site-specific integrase [Peptostreptococcus porci]|uniref:tyrosine-type recombinase/integrase n=1 Tax=Peptostreptococcus porci TaxID=2652282 RepID=UPI002A83E690|nr:site-specific integrase [Peptostreptococcus porci]MDY4128666.1 site-specific integrase [Peptostreptococcus porci]